MGPIQYLLVVENGLGMGQTFGASRRINNALKEENLN